MTQNTKDTLFNILIGVLFIIFCIMIIIFGACKSSELQDYEPEIIVQSTMYINSFKKGDINQQEKILHQKISRKENGKVIVEEKKTTEKVYCDKEYCEIIVEDSEKGIVYRRNKLDIIKLVIME